MTIRGTIAGFAGPIHDRLIVYAAVAVAAGLLLPSVAGRLSGGVPYMLGGQVLGVALTLTLGRFAVVAPQVYIKSHPDPSFQSASIRVSPARR